MLKVLLPSGYMPRHLRLLDLIGLAIRRTVKNMKILIVVSCPLPIRIPLRPKYSPQEPIFKYP